MSDLTRYHKARNLIILPTTYVPGESYIIKCDQYKFVTFNIGYTRAGAGGAVTYKVEFSGNKDDTTSWAQTSFVSTQTLAQGSDLKNWIQRVDTEYVAVGDELERFMTDSYIISAPFCRIIMKESGNLVTPGTADAFFFLNGEK